MEFKLWWPTNQSLEKKIVNGDQPIGANDVFIRPVAGDQGERPKRTKMATKI